MREAQPVTLLFGGDFAPRGRYETLIAETAGDILGAARELVAAADFTLFNLEVPLCDAGAGIAKSGPVIRAMPETLRTLTANGVDAVCLANNHILDHGSEGLAQTISALEQRGLGHVGAGLSRAAAETPLRITRDSRRISIFSFAEQEFNLSEDGEAGAALLDPLRIAPLVTAERGQSDVLIVCVHGGNEYFPWPRPGLRRICHFLIEMGADAVIGHHPHVPGPYEIHRGKPIFYSLGNLIFDTAKPPHDWDLGYLARLELRFDPAGPVEITPGLIPYRQSVAQGGLRLLNGEERAAFLARIETMRDRLENRPQDWLAAWQDFVQSKARQSAIDLSSPVRFPGLQRLLGFAPLRNLISPPSRRLHRLNLLRCESHRELVVAALASPPESPR